MKTNRAARLFCSLVLLSASSVNASPQHISVPGAPFNVDVYGYDNTFEYHAFSSKPSDELSVEQMECGKKQYAEIAKALVGENYKYFLSSATNVSIDVNQYKTSIIDDAEMQSVPANEVTISKDQVYVRSIVRKADRHYTSQYVNECELVTAAQIKAEFELKTGITASKRAQTLANERTRTENAIRSINKILSNP